MPTLPEERPELVSGVMRDIKRTARADEVGDVATSLAVGIEALQYGAVDDAIPYLEWAMSRAPRSAPIREALGIAYYQLGRFEDAQREILTYRRISGRFDQNHLLADCARATGREDKVVGFVDELRDAVDTEDAPVDRLIEAILVYAGMRADHDDFGAALALLDDAPLDDEIGDSHIRVWYAIADIADRAGDTEKALEYFSSVSAVDEGFLDVGERLASLS